MVTGPGDQRLLISHERHGTALAIWAPGDEQVDEIEIDLPGEVEASWYPGGDALLLVHVWRGRSELFRFDLITRRLEGIDTPTGMVTEARIHPSGELWYAITSSAQPPVVHCGPETLRPPGEQAPPGVAYRDLEQRRGARLFGGAVRSAAVPNHLCGPRWACSGGP